MTSSRTTPGNFAILRGVLKLAVGASMGLVPTIANASPVVSTTYVSLDPIQPGQVLTGEVCTGTWRCHAHVHATKEGKVQTYTAPQGYGPADLASAYNIPANPVSGTPTVVLVDAYGYASLESDLATYRSTFNLPPCSTASGCLTIVNQQGATSPLPGPPPPNDNWNIETALDVDMVSAGCPGCKIVVIQATDDTGSGLFLANNLPSTFGATVVSNSWGGPESPNQPAVSLETFFNHPGAAIFASAGDNGFDDGGQGPDYPATSAFTIGVGGTTLQRNTSTRGWGETAWSTSSGQGAGGSACSLTIPQPAYQASLNTTCKFKASSEVSAVGDPQTGLAIFTDGSWTVVGGTSAASPLVAAIWAATGNGENTDGGFVAAHASSFNDVTSGTNGTCGNILCNAGPGWDGPTGFGTPNATLLIQDASGSGNGGSADDEGTDNIIGGCAATGGRGGIASLLVVGALVFSRRRRA